ncbi:MAG: hypothetical protein AAB074_03590 [Planctomycetota bacterium]
MKARWALVSLAMIFSGCAGVTFPKDALRAILEESNKATSTTANVIAAIERAKGDDPDLVRQLGPQVLVLQQLHDNLAAKQTAALQTLELAAKTGSNSDQKDCAETLGAAAKELKSQVGDYQKRVQDMRNAAGLNFDMVPMSLDLTSDIIAGLVDAALKWWKALEEQERKERENFVTYLQSYHAKTWDQIRSEVTKRK